MSLMKFYEGSEAKAQSYLDGLYLASDSNKLYYNGKSYTPDLTDMKNSIGTNVYTDSNYISKETNLTDAVLQLDEEIKATNDNLDLEHANAEATYAKKTELDGYLPLTGGILTGTTEIHQDGSQLCLFGGVDGIAQYNENNNIIFALQASDNGSGYLTVRDKDNSDIYTYITKSGVTISGKTTSDLLNAGGGTTSITLDGAALDHARIQIGDDYINIDNSGIVSYYHNYGTTVCAHYITQAGFTDFLDNYLPSKIPTKVSDLANDSGFQTEAQVSAKVSALVNSAPEALDTLKELADALGNDPNFATTISTELGKKLDTSTYTTDKATFALKSELPDMSQYTTTTSLQSTYVTKTTADSTYQPKGNYLTNVSWDQVSGKPAFATVATSGSYNDLTNKPIIPAAVTVDSALSSTSTNPVQNKVINSALAGKAASSHTHAISEITNLQSTLDGKAASSHTHTASQVSGLATVATSGSYNDLSNKPSIPQPTVSAASGNLTLWTGTESEYNSISSKDPNTLYFILES